MSGLSKQATPPGEQDLDLYWDPEMASILDTWGEDHVWNEIQMFLANRRGRVLDIACGTGRTMEILSKFKNLKLYGCDISDFLIKKAIERGIDEEYLMVCDATKMDCYKDAFFNYSFSIGSLEHFTKEGISKFIEESYRTVKYSSFHLIPVSRSGKNEGWMKTKQSFYNNSVGWWLRAFEAVYQEVYVIESGWHDKISVGKWFLCVKNDSS